MRRTLLFALPLLIAGSLSAQITVTISINDRTGEDTFIHNGPTQQDNNYSSLPALNFYAWTNSGVPRIKRSFLKFDLDTIPDNADVLDARLSLYYNPDDIYEGIDIHSGPNAWVIERVVGTWDPAAITWNSQPSVTTLNAVTMPATTNGTMDFGNIDVTGLVQDMILAGESGFRLRMATEVPYRMIILSSGNDPNEARHPKLTISYREKEDVGVHDATGTTAQLQQGNGQVILQRPVGAPLDRYSIVDAAGRQVAGGVLVGERTVWQTAPWSGGVYTLLIDGQDGRQVRRFVAGGR